MEYKQMEATSGINGEGHKKTKSHWNRKWLGWGGDSITGVIWKGCYSYLIQQTLEWRAPLHTPALSYLCVCALFRKTPNGFYPTFVVSIHFPRPSSKTISSVEPFWFQLKMIICTQGACPEFHPHSTLVLGTLGLKYSRNLYVHLVSTP